MDKPERRRPGRPPQDPSQRERTIDTHLNLPISVVEKIDRLRNGESRRDFIVRVLREYSEEE